jgi:hypothetical protein
MNNAKKLLTILSMFACAIVLAACTPTATPEVESESSAVGGSQEDAMVEDDAMMEEESMEADEAMMEDEDTMMEDEAMDGEEAMMEKEN